MWLNVRIGTTQAHIVATIVQSDKRIGIGLYIRNNKELFHELYAKKDQIEQELGFSLDWRELPDKKASRVTLQRDGDYIKALEEGQEEYRKE